MYPFFMPPKFSPQELGQIQQFQEEEGLWIDTVIRARAPRILVILAERGNGNGLVSRSAALLASWWTRLEKGHKRHVARDIRTKGFRKAHLKETLAGITTTLYKHKRSCKQVRNADGVFSRPMCADACVVASHRFDIGIQLRA